MAGDSVPSSMKLQTPGHCEFPQHCSNLCGLTLKTCLVLLQVKPAAKKPSRQVGAARTLWCSAASSITVPMSFPACVNTLGWINEIQEMGKRSLNPELVFLLLEIKKEKKGKEDPGKMHLESAKLVKGGREVC